MKFSINEAMSNPVAAQSLQTSGVAKQIRCAMPGIIRGYDHEMCTAVVQPAIRESLDGDMQNLPEIECPVFMPGGYRVPVSIGDECLVIFADTSIDSWWASGGVQPPSSLRRHNLSDGFALVGFFSRPRVGAANDEVAPKSWVLEQIEAAVAAALGGGS